MGLTLNAKRYSSLLAEHVPRRIDSQSEYDHWADWLEATRFDEASTPEDHALADVITILLEDFDRREHPDLSSSDPLTMLHYVMERHSITKADLGRLLEVSRATASNIYSGKQGISKRSAAILAKHFKLSIQAFLPNME